MSKKTYYFAFDKILRDAGFVLIRQQKHAIYKHPTGALVVLSTSTQRSGSFNNQQAEVRKAIRRAQQAEQEQQQ